MSQVFMGQVMLFAGNFAPRGFMLCQGQLLPIAQYASLFAIFGTLYGGNGTTNFALPNLVGNAAVGNDDNSTDPQYPVGRMTGSTTVALNSSNNPPHQHQLVVVNAAGTTAAGSGNVLAAAVGGSKSQSYTAAFYSPNAGQARTELIFNELVIMGDDIAHNNMQPYLAITMCISIDGHFPPRG